MFTSKPILFSSPMIRALLDSRKTQTRRIIKPQPPSGKIIDECSYSNSGFAFWNIGNNGELDGCTCDGVKNIYGFPGNYLWVRETWKPDQSAGIAGSLYRADNTFIEIENTIEASDKWIDARKPEEQWPKLIPPKWRPSIFMPRWASRLTLKIINIRAERLTDISVKDAIANGIDHKTINCPKVEYQLLWDSLNGKTYPWSNNPWVWVIEFEVLKRNIDKCLND